MKKIINFLTITVICISFSTTLLALEKSISPIISVSKEIKTRLKTGSIVAIFLSGNDSLLTRIVEDSIAIQLTNTGFTVINRETLEKSIGEQVSKKKEEAGGAVNALEIGKAVNAGCILTGTVIIESGGEKLASVRTASFQLVDVPSEKSLISVVLESERGDSISELSKRFLDILTLNMK